MSMMPAVAGVSEPVRLAIPEAEKDIISITKNISYLLLCFLKTHEFRNSKSQRTFVFLAAVNHHHLGNRSFLERVLKVVVCDWQILICFVCLCVSRFVACDHNYD